MGFGNRQSDSEDFDRIATALEAHNEIERAMLAEMRAARTIKVAEGVHRDWWSENATTDQEEAADRLTAEVLGEDAK